MTFARSALAERANARTSIDCEVGCSVGVLDQPDGLDRQRSCACERRRAGRAKLRTIESSRRFRARKNLDFLYARNGIGVQEVEVMHAHRAQEEREFLRIETGDGAGRVDGAREPGEPRGEPLEAVAVRDAFAALEQNVTQVSPVIGLR